MRLRFVAEALGCTRKFAYRRTRQAGIPVTGSTTFATVALTDVPRILDLLASLMDNRGPDFKQLSRSEQSEYARIIRNLMEQDRIQKADRPWMHRESVELPSGNPKSKQDQYYAAVYRGMMLREQQMERRARKARRAARRERKAAKLARKTGDNPGQ